jgi:6-pyruvoyltetrahydropterin/6-carboxytetrahydropterin synthase
MSMEREHATRRAGQEGESIRPPAGALVRVTRRLHFSSAHRLGRADWPDERNREVFGLCANPNWHGHNYEIDVTVEGPVDPETGYVIDLKALRELVERRVINDLDHRNLNIDVPWLERVNPTTENLVIRIWNRIVDQLPQHMRLVRLVLHETARNSVEYTGERTDNG